MGMRAIVSITEGRLPLKTWVDASMAEPPVSGEPVACAACPLRVEGEWVDGLRAALAEGTPVTLRRWGCHASPRPCAGMRRMLKGAP